MVIFNDVQPESCHKKEQEGEELRSTERLILNDSCGNHLSRKEATPTVNLSKGLHILAGIAVHSIGMRFRENKGNTIA